MNRQSGMTMVELMVGLVIVMLIIGAATTAYLKLLRTYKTQGRLAEGYMANLTGLELLRYDIEMAGFGLPALLAAGAVYTEATAPPANAPAPPYDPTLLNDSGNVPNVPRALVHLNNAGANGSDVLAIKSSAANAFNNPAGKKWSMIINSGPNPQVKLWGVTALDPVMDFTAGDNFIILDNSGTLQPLAGPWGCYRFNSSVWNGGYYANASSIPYPSSQHVYYIFGLDNSTAGHTMPFNRVDYYLDKIPGDFPSTCAQSTYTLYRSLIDQASGQLVKAPLIDCVRDFQVAFGLDTSGGALPIQWQDNLTGMSAAQIQQQLREVRVFVLFQEGLGDTSTSPSFRFSGVLNLGDQDIAHGLDNSYPAPPNGFQQLSSSALSGHPSLSSFPPAGADLQYRWKIIEIDAKPMNLLNLISGTPR